MEPATILTIARLIPATRLMAVAGLLLFRIVKTSTQPVRTMLVSVFRGVGKTSAVATRTAAETTASAKGTLAYQFPATAFPLAWVIRIVVAATVPANTKRV